MNWFWRIVILIWLTSVIGMYIVAMADRLPMWMYRLINWFRGKGKQEDNPDSKPFRDDQSKG